MKRHIPNFITLLNLLSGFVAVVLASRGSTTEACFLIMAGMVFDFADGLSARLLKAYSDIGKDLDSLADVVTFGAAPGAILFSLLTSAGLPFVPSLIIAGFVPAASALRLAKFNNDPGQSVSFKGMATPASAFTLVSLVLAAHYSRFSVYDALAGSVWFLTGLSLFLSVMMLINMRMFSLKFSHLKMKGNEERYLFICISLILIVLFGAGSLPPVMAAYILISFLSALLRRSGASA